VSQLDRLLLAKYLNLGDFGIYSLAANIAAYVSRAIAPLVGALYPRFTQLVEAGDQIGLEHLYSRACSYAGLVTLPVALCFATMPTPILAIFTGSQHAAQDASWILMLLASGAALTAYSNMAYSVQQAHGNQLFALKVNAAYLFTYSPLLWFAISRWGALGAAGAYFLLHTVNFIIHPTYSALRYFPKGGFAVYWTGFVWPLAFACVPFIATYFVPWHPFSRTGYALYCGTATAMAYLGIILGYCCFFPANPLVGMIPTAFRRRGVASRGRWQ
jgi:O-antigen/teichoic acid export membrane protein